MPACAIAGSAGTVALAGAVGVLLVGATAVVAVDAISGWADTTGAAGNGATACVAGVAGDVVVGAFWPKNNAPARPTPASTATPASANPRREASCLGTATGGTLGTTLW